MSISEHEPIRQLAQMVHQLVSTSNGPYDLATMGVPPAFIPQKYHKNMNIYDRILSGSMKKLMKKGRVDTEQKLA